MTLIHLDQCVGVHIRPGVARCHWTRMLHPLTEIRCRHLDIAPGSGTWRHKSTAGCHEAGQIQIRGGEQVLVTLCFVRDARA
jgi:hypothetical protein